MGISFALLAWKKSGKSKITSAPSAISSHPSFSSSNGSKTGFDYVLHISLILNR
jgi:hypothetical protein